MAEFILLHGPQGQQIDLNVKTVVTVRDNRDASNNYRDGEIKCTIHTTDGRIVAVVETCDVVREKVKEINR